MKTVSVCLFIIGGLLLVTGLICGFYPLTSPFGQQCGSAFLPRNVGHLDFAITGLRLTGHLPSFDCVSVRHRVRIPAVALLIAGGLSVAGGWVVVGVKREGVKRLSTPSP